MTWIFIYLRIEQIIGSLICILQRRLMSCCPTTGGPFWRALLMTFEGVCHQTPCFRLRVPCTARWCIKVLLYSSSTPAELADDNSFPTVDGADAAAVSSNTPRGQLPVWWGSGGFSVWDWNHESILLPYLWFLHNCPFRSEHWQQSHHIVTPSWPLSSSPTDFISHSFSISELQFIFQKVLPDLNGCVLVDVGSRLGAVLYGVSISKTDLKWIWHQ